VDRERGWRIEVVHRPDRQARRPSRDYERLPAVAEEMIDTAMSRIMLRRLARTTGTNMTA